MDVDGDEGDVRKTSNETDGADDWRPPLLLQGDVGGSGLAVHRKRALAFVGQAHIHQPRH